MADLNMKLRLCAAAAAGLAGAACSSNGGADPVRAAAAANTEDGVIVTALPDASLPKGSCGMILWTLDNERPAPVFRYVSSKTADAVINGAPVELRPVSASGVAAFGVSEAQAFVSDTGLRADVAFRFSLGFDGGSYIERGLVSITSEDGWKTVIPTAGIAGCRAK